VGCTNGCVRGVVGRRAARAIIPSPTSEAAWESARARASCKRRTTTPAFRSLQPTAAPSGSPCEPRSHAQASAVPVRCSAAPSVPMVETEQDRFWQGDKPTACQKRTEPRSQSATAIRPHGRDRAGSVLARRQADGVSQTRRGAVDAGQTSRARGPIRPHGRDRAESVLARRQADGVSQTRRGAVDAGQTSRARGPIRPHGRDRAGSVLARRRADGVSQTRRGAVDAGQTSRARGPIRPHGRDRAGSVLARRQADGVSQTRRGAVDAARIRSCSVESSSQLRRPKIIASLTISFTASK